MQLKIETLETANEYINKLEPPINDLIECYREGNGLQEIEIMLDIIDGLRWVIDVMRHTQDILTSRIDIANIKEALQNIMGAMENQDDVLIADVFEYEVLEILQQYHEIIKDTLQTSNTVH